jgi:hypothetical protein
MSKCRRRKSSSLVLLRTKVNPILGKSILKWPPPQPLTCDQETYTLKKFAHESKQSLCKFGIMALRLHQLSAAGPMVGESMLTDEQTQFMIENACYMCRIKFARQVE